MSHYAAYYSEQAGGGASEKHNRFTRIYVGAPYQRGHGIGAFLGGLFRRILPFLGGAARAVGKEALNAGINVVGDIATRRVPLKESLEKRLTESGLRLKRKASDKIEELMSGSGYKRVRKRRRSQKRMKRRRKSVAGTRRKKRKRTTTRKRKGTKRRRRKTTRRRRRQSSKRTVRDIFG